MPQQNSTLETSTRFVEIFTSEIRKTQKSLMSTDPTIQKERKIPCLKSKIQISFKNWRQYRVKEQEEISSRNNVNRKTNLRRRLYFDHIL